MNEMLEATLVYILLMSAYNYIVYMYTGYIYVCK